MTYSAIDIANKVISIINNQDGGDNISNLCLQKILYYLQINFIKFYNKKLFNDQISIHKYGPVVYNVYNKFTKDLDIDNFISKNLSKDILSLSKEEEALFQEVLYVYGQFSASKLKDMFFEEELPYLKIEDNIIIQKWGQYL